MEGPPNVSENHGFRHAKKAGYPRANELISPPWSTILPKQLKPVQ